MYAHVPKELRRKLDEKAKKFIFVGYAENAKGYRLLDTRADRVIISRDVNFLDEDNESKEIIIQKKQDERTQNDEESILDPLKEKLQIQKTTGKKKKKRQ